MEALRAAEKVTVLTGSGVSAESNIPTFRDAMTGLWSRFRAEDLATPEAFQRDPELVWNWYQSRRDMVNKAQPNLGHHALAAMEKNIPSFTLITQNVDNLHQQAGSTNVLELHGNITRVKCSQEHRQIENWTATEQVPPPCPHCGAPLRPDVVWFGESLPQSTLAQALSASREADLFFSIGTSAQVQPAASLIYEAMGRGAISVEINPTATAQATQVSYVLAAPSGKILPALQAAAWPLSKS